MRSGKNAAIIWRSSGSIFRKVFLAMSTPVPSTSPWPGDLFDFAYIPVLDEKLAELAGLAETEDWTYQHTHSEHPYPILFNYVRYTYRRVAEESKVSLSDDGQFSCFNSGLVTPNQEALYASFETNRKEGAPQPWFFKNWLRRGQWELTKFADLPDIAHYFDDPNYLVFDNRRDFRVNIEHIIVETPRDRFPEPYSAMEDYALQTVLKGAIDNAKERVKR